MTPTQIEATGLSPFDRALGLELVSYGPDRVVARLEIGPAHLQPYGIVHGGVYCTMAETVASLGAALAAGDSPTAGAVGQSNHTDFLRPARGGTITATATPVHVGRTVQLWQVELVGDDGRLVAQSKVRTFAVDLGRMDGAAG